MLLPASANEPVLNPNTTGDQRPGRKLALLQGPEDRDRDQGRRQLGTPRVPQRLFLKSWLCPACRHHAPARFVAGLRARPAARVSVSLVDPAARWSPHQPLAGTLAPGPGSGRAREGPGRDSPAANSVPASSAVARNSSSELGSVTDCGARAERAQAAPSSCTSLVCSCGGETRHGRHRDPPNPIPGTLTDGAVGEGGPQGRRYWGPWGAVRRHHGG